MYRLREVVIDDGMLYWFQLCYKPTDWLIVMGWVYVSPIPVAVRSGVGLRPFDYWGRGLESSSEHGCLSVVLSCVGRGLCDGLITRPEESYRVSICMCDHRNPERGGQRSVLDYKRLWMNETMSQNCSHKRAYCSFPGNTWAWRMIVMMMPAGDNSWLVYQSSLVVLPADTSGESRRNGWRSEDFVCQYLKHLKEFLTCRKILGHGTSGFTSHPKEGVLRIFIALKNPSPRPVCRFA
jgi:hypothetical protein